LHGVVSLGKRTRPPVRNCALTIVGVELSCQPDPRQALSLTHYQVSTGKTRA